jgi:hypothetical protein
VFRDVGMQFDVGTLMIGCYLMVGGAWHVKMSWMPQV